LVVVPFVGHHELSVDLSLQDACRLYEFNDNHLSEFQKIIVARLKEKIRDLENDVTAKDLLLDKLQREVTAKDLLMDKLQKEQEGKEIEVKISRFGKLQEKRFEVRSEKYSGRQL
jgi:serine phosphatase RsbU (regulator of sigma subunit)